MYGGSRSIKKSSLSMLAYLIRTNRGLLGEEAKYVVSLT
jgi:hypothetical protein